MKQNVNIIRQMAKEAYLLSKDGILDKIAGLTRWEHGPNIRRIVSMTDAMDKLVKVELAELVYLGFVLLIEIEDGRWIPVKTWDFMTGLDSKEQTQVAKFDVELARALKGDEAPLDEMM